MSSLRRTLSSGTAFTLFSFVVVQVISLATSVIVARLLGRQDLGVLALITQLSATVVPLAVLGMGTAVTSLIPSYTKGRRPDELPVLISSTFVTILVAGTIVSAAYFGLSFFLAEAYRVPELALFTQISSLLIVFDALLALAAAVVQGFQRIKELAFIGLAARAATVPLMFGMTLLWGLLGTVIAGAIWQLANAVIYFRAVRTVLRSEKVEVSWFRFDRRAAGTALRFGLPLFASFVILRPALLFQTSFLALYVGYAELGLFRVAWSLYRIALLLPSSLSVPLLPAISEMYATGSVERTRGQLTAVLRMTAFLSLPLTLSIGFGSTMIIGFLYGPEYIAAAPLVFIISIVAFVDTVGTVLENTLLATRRTRSVFLLTIMQACVITVASLLLITSFGLLGIGLAMLLNSVLYVGVVSTYLLKKGELSFQGIRRALFLSVIAFAGAAAVVGLIGLGNVVSSLTFLAVVVLVEVRLLPRNDRRMLVDVLVDLVKRVRS